MLYRGGDRERPETNMNYYRLYSHNLCPYSARVRYTMNFLGIKFQEMVMNTQEKADWHFNVNEGLVPFVETTKGDIIKESEDILFWIQEQVDAQSLLPNQRDIASMHASMRSFCELV